MERERAMAKKKRYEVRATCPNCACGTVSHMSAEEIRSKTIDGDKLEINCPECMELHRANIKSACPDYAEECHL
jgi:RNase P subunit RPR2